MRHPFRQVDVFGSGPLLGNPLAVVLDAEDVSPEAMQRFANWRNLSETTFVVPPTDPAADYRVRIFDPTSELPFAGHPTLGTCHAWLEAGGRPRDPGRIVQECGAGLVPVRRTDDGLAFRAPPPLRSGPVDESTLSRVAVQLRIDRHEIVDAQWAANGPNWIAILLADADAVLSVRPGTVDMDIGIVGPYPPGGSSAFEVRAFFPKDGSTAEDPVTGSLNGALAGWLVKSGRAVLPYVASQGTVLGRAGRVHLLGDDDVIWVAGATTTIVTGEVEIPA
jgi:PhzF family phenazine biosynthesis protein